MTRSIARQTAPSRIDRLQPLASAESRAIGEGAVDNRLSSERVAAAETVDKSSGPPTPRAGLFDAAAFVILTLALGTVLVLAKDVLVPIALAVLLSFALSPIVRAFQRIGAPRAVAIGAALGLAIASGSVCLWLLSGQIEQLGAGLPKYQSTVEQKIHTIAAQFSGGGQLSQFFAMIERVSHEFAPNPGANGGDAGAQHVVVVDDSPVARLGTLGGYASPLLSPIAVIALVLLLTGFMLAQRADLRNRLIKLIGAKDIQRTTEAIDDAGRRVGRMMFAQITLNSVFGAGIGLGLWLIGVPNPLLWAAIAAISRFVPYIGVAVGLIPPLLVAFAFDPGWAAFLETFALFAIAELITGQIVEPVLYGHSSGLSPMAVVISTAVWAFLWGPVGLVLATPLTICLVVIGRHVPGLSFIETMLGDAPSLEPHEIFYQRMLAGDPREAYVQAKQFLKNRTIATYYDEIALDAIRRAHVDIVRGDVDEARLETLTASMRQLVGWLGELRSKGFRGRRLSAEATAALVRSRVEQDVVWNVLERSELSDLWLGDAPVAVLHDNHPLDAIAASMLAQSLKRQGLTSRVASLSQAQAASAEEAGRVALVYLCFIEPLRWSYVRVVAGAIRARCPNAKLALCVWRETSGEKLIGRARRLRVDFIATNIFAALSAAVRLAATRRFPIRGKREAANVRSGASSSPEPRAKLSQASYTVSGQIER